MAAVMEAWWEPVWANIREGGTAWRRGREGVVASGMAMWRTWGEGEVSRWMPMVWEKEMRANMHPSSPTARRAACRPACAASTNSPSAHASTSAMHAGRVNASPSSCPSPPSEGGRGEEGGGWWYSMSIAECTISGSPLLTLSLR